MVVNIQVNMHVTQETIPKLPSLTFLSNFLKKVNMDIKDLMTPKTKISVQANEPFCMSFPTRDQDLIHTHINILYH